MTDRTLRIGYVERIERDGVPPFRGWDADRLWVLGYADTLAQAAECLWLEYVQRRRKPPAG